MNLGTSGAGRKGWQVGGVVFAALALAVMSFGVPDGGCGGPPEVAGGADDDLTSVTARSRELKFESVVYVDKGASQSTILSAAQAQTRTAFGALQHLEIAVNNRELHDIDPASFKKRDVQVIDAGLPGDAGRAMTEVRYTYVDNALVPVSMARRTSVAASLLNKGTNYNGPKVVSECTENSEHSRDYPNWYEFNPTLASCKKAMKAEATAIDADVAKLKAGTAAKVPKSAVDRTYLPITLTLGADKTNKGTSYPEYDRLYTGGVQANKLVLGFMYGMIDDDPSKPEEDYNFGEWMTHLDLVFKARPGFKLVKTEPAIDLSTVTLASGKQVTGITFDQIIRWKLDGTGWPAGVTATDRPALLAAVAKKLYKVFLTFEVPVKVKIGAAAEKDFTVAVLTYFGVESDTWTHKRAIKASDVYLYNGHSYIGSGPLDPGNFSAGDFPASYQIFFIDGCVSYNYYEKDYLPLKSGGTKNLDLITNGLEAPSYRSGYALGRFSAALIDGTFPSYSTLLKAAAATDPMRVVDGEVDNVWSPTKAKIVLR
jgi:hypothetical protein